MKSREWYEKRLLGHSSNQQDIIRLLLDIRDLLEYLIKGEEQK